jgi:hypothetical protein
MPAHENFGGCQEGRYAAAMSEVKRKRQQEEDMS